MGDSSPLQRGSKRGSLCVTDTAIMNNCNKLVAATTSRELLFYDLAKTTYKCQYRVHGMSR